jgi:uridine phosphorylase
VSEKPIITPRELLSLDGIEPPDCPFTVAAIGFCPFHGFKRKAQAKPLQKSLLSHVNASNQFAGTAGERPVLMVECVYGGPVIATVIEEMAYLGVESVVGFGYAGSLREAVKPGTIVLASSGIVSDGTSREYTQSDEVRAGAAIRAVYEGLAPSLGSAVSPAKVWTTGALYREYPGRVASWREAGADIVNMDTSPFYAASEAVGVEAICFSLITDYIGGEAWEQEFPDLSKPREQLWDLVLNLAARL